MNSPDILMLDQAGIAAVPGNAEHVPERRLTVNDPRLKRLQRIHAIGISCMGLIGLSAAAYLHYRVQPVSSTAIALFFVFFFLNGSGITIGFHRYFTHRSFHANAAVKAILGIAGSMSGQGPVVYWTAVHRMHHMLADRKGDPHSPNLHGDGLWNKARGALHAFIGWTVAHDVPNTNVFSRDLLSDRMVMWINRRYYLWLLAGWAIPAAVGGIVSGSAYGALEGLVWGGLLRMLAVNSALYAVAFAGHSPFLGSRAFSTRDQSKNNIWLAIPTLGDSWHNNHHAFPQAAIIGLRWWQLDISGLTITAMEKCGVVSEVCRVAPEEISEQSASRS